MPARRTTASTDPIAPPVDIREVTRIGRVWAFSVRDPATDTWHRYRTDMGGRGLYLLHRPAAGVAAWSPTQLCATSYQWPRLRPDIEPAITEVFARARRPR